MLLDYFLEYSGDTDSKEQLSLAEGGSFSHTAVFSMAHLAKCTCLKKHSKKKSIQEGANTEDSTPPCTGSLALVSGWVVSMDHWVQVGSAEPRKP